jgi:DNA-binding transcriptional ArsR family regulator
MPNAQRDLVFKALSDPTRRSLFEQLSREGEQSVRALTDLAGVSQPAVSKHLAVLREANLVRDRAEGREVRYSAHIPGLAPLFDWIGHYKLFWVDRFDRLDNLLKRMDQ